MLWARVSNKREKITGSMVRTLQRLLEGSVRVDGIKQTEESEFFFDL